MGPVVGWPSVPPGPRVPPVPPPLASFAGLRSRALTLPSSLFFFVLSCILPFSCLLSVLLGGAEQQLMRGRNALLCNQVIRTNHYLLCAYAFDYLVSGRRIFLVLRYTHVSFLLSVSIPSLARLGRIKCSLHFFLNRMHVPVSLRADDLEEQRQALAVFYNSLLSGGSFPIPQASDACAIEGKP